jgi:Ca2+-binding RTX toxin-like protein
MSADPTDATNPYTTLSAQARGVDVNPASLPDRLRIVAGDGEDLRVNADTGLTITDAPMNPGTPSIDAAAYLNPTIMPGVTTLYDHDFGDNSLYTQNPPNNGTLVLVGATGVTADVADTVQMDITAGGQAFLSLEDNGSQRLYSLNLGTGAATEIGAMPGALAGMTVVDNATGFSAPATTVDESAAKASVTIKRSSPTGTSRVDWTAQGGSATLGDDLSPASGTVVFAPGQTDATVDVPIVDDAAAEQPESFTVRLTANTATTSDTGGLVTEAPAKVTIADNDAPKPPVSAAPADRDGDGVADSTDNCANVANADQRDGDRDGIGTACDLTEVATAPLTRTPLPGRCTNVTTGTPADDGLAGSAAGDRLNGLGGSDGLFGAAGDDCLTGGAGDDWLSGGPGNDDLRGEAGNDVLLGGDGNDVLNGGAGTNTLSAGRGNDTVSARNGRTERIDCGAGRDTATVDRRDRTRNCERVRRPRR